MNIDWKDALRGLQESGSIPRVPEEDAADKTARPEAPLCKADKLNIIVERKGRRGKTATIIEGFSCGDAELQHIAQTLKKKIGTGGSARGGEILLQGEFREKAAAELRALGYKC